MWSYKVGAAFVRTASQDRIASCRESEINLVSSHKDEQISYFGNDGPFPVDSSLQDKCGFKMQVERLPLLVHCLRLCAPNAGSTRLIPGWGTEILHATQCGQKFFFNKKL